MTPDKRRRRRSWTASQRRSRLNSKDGGTTNNAVDGLDIIAADQYAKKLNPYKQISSSLRSSTDNSVKYLTTRDITNDDDTRLNVDGDDLNLDDDDDDDDMRLDNILSSIVNDSKDVSKLEAVPSVVDSNEFHSKLSVSSVDFGSTHPIETPPVQNTSSSFREVGNISPVSEEDRNWNNGDSARLHNIVPRIDQEPTFAATFEGAKPLDSIPMTTEPTIHQMGVNTGNGGSGNGGVSPLKKSCVDFIIDDIGMNYTINRFVSGPELDNILNPITTSTANASASRRDRFSTHGDRRRAQKLQTTVGPEDAVHRKLHDGAPQSIGTSNKNNAPSSRTQSHAPGVKIVHPKSEDETLSTVTDPTESPFIYTYRKSNDDDSVSQITSSLAGNSLGPSYRLQNIPTSTNALKNVSGLSWMTYNDGRKGGMIIPGPYGRGRDRRSPKAASGGSGYSRWSDKGSSNGNDSVGSNSYDDGKKNLDEIAYALNTDCSSGRNQRAMITRRPPARVGSVRLPSGGDNLSTVASINSRDSGPGDHKSSSYAYVDTNINANVSRLGMGGVSCAAASVYTEATTDSTRSLGFFQRVALLAWKAQHHAGRFFFPTSMAIKRRKKFDKSDSMSDIEDILLEEGENAPSHRQQRGSRGGQLYDDDNDDIDYFSRAMSVSNNHSGLRRMRKSIIVSYFGRGKRSKMGCLIFAMAVMITIYRLPQNRGNFSARPRNKDGQHIGKKSLVYDSIQHGDDQVFGHSIDAIVDSNAHLEESVGILGADRSRQAIVQYDTQLPPVFEALANVGDPLYQRGADVPFYWHIPRSGGGTMNDILGSCFHLTLAADAGGSEGYGQQETLEVLLLSHQVSYVNVDTSTHQGIAHAKSLNLVSSGLADVLISPLLHEASALFNLSRRGRMFAMFRHPVDRAASLFYFIQETQWRQPTTRRDQFADISIENFYKRGFAENNWMTRFLTNELTKRDLTDNDLSIAKEVLRQKCLVGLLEAKVETFDRLQNYFGWGPKDDEKKECLEKKLEWSWPMKHNHPKIEKESKAWTLIAAANSFDMKLYGYAKELFYLQGQQLFLNKEV